MASVTQTVFDQNPVAIFGVSKVLLPREFFGKNPIEVDKPSDGGGVMSTAQPPDIALSPDSSSHLSAPPGLELRSARAAEAVAVLRITMLCMLMSYLSLWL